MKTILAFFLLTISALAQFQPAPSGGGGSGNVTATGTISPGATMLPARAFFATDSMMGSGTITGSGTVGKYWPPGFTGNPVALSGSLYNAVPSGYGNDIPTQFASQTGCEVYTTSFSTRPLYAIGGSVDSFQGCLTQEAVTLAPVNTKVATPMNILGGVNDAASIAVTSGTTMFLASGSLCASLHALGYYPVVMGTILATGSGVYPVGSAQDIKRLSYNAQLMALTGTAGNGINVLSGTVANQPDIIVQTDVAVPSLASTGTFVSGTNTWYTLQAGAYGSDNIHPSGTSNVLLASMFVNCDVAVSPKIYKQRTKISSIEMYLTTFAPWNFQIYGWGGNGTGGNQQLLQTASPPGINNTSSDRADCCRLYAGSGTGGNYLYINVAALGQLSWSAASDPGFIDWTRPVGFGGSFKPFISGTVPVSNWEASIGKSSAYVGLLSGTSEVGMQLWVTGSNAAASTLNMFLVCATGTSLTVSATSAIPAWLFTAGQCNYTVYDDSYGNATVTINGVPYTFNGVAPSGTYGRSKLGIGNFINGGSTSSNSSDYLNFGRAFIWTE